MKKLLASLLVATMTLSLAACGGSSTGSADGANAGGSKGTARYSLGSGSSGGNFYLVGGGLSTVINNALPDQFVITSEETGGSTANLTMLQNGDVEMGISMTSSMAEAWAGEAEWTGGPMDKLRGMVPLYPSYLTIYTKADSGIKSLSDFNGKIIGLGSKGAAMDSVFREVFEDLGIKPASIFNDGHGATATALADGQIDAALLFSFPPFAAISELEATHELTFIPLSAEEQQYLVDTYPFYSAGSMPAGSYKGATEDVPVVVEWNMLVTNSDVPEDEVYAMAKALFDNNDKLLEVHKSLSYVTADNCVNFNIPLHKGIVKYLNEAGIEVPAELIEK